MKVFLTLVRRHATESRWVLGLAAAAFFGLSILTVWLTRRAERVLEGGLDKAPPDGWGPFASWAGRRWTSPPSQWRSVFGTTRSSY